MNVYNKKFKPHPHPHPTHPTTKQKALLYPVKCFALSFSVEVTLTFSNCAYIYDKRISLVCDLNRTPVVMAKHGCSCVHFFSGISTCGRTSRETVSHPQSPPLPAIYKYLYPSTLLWQINGCKLQQQPGIIHWCYLIRSWKFNDV